MEIFGIKFAPLNVPLKRRLETLVLAVTTIMTFFGHHWAYPLTYYAIFHCPTLRYFMILYFVWMYYDWDTRNKGGRSMRWVRLLRRSAWMRYFNNYFPVKLEKTADLDPNRNYLFVSFPHGILPIGLTGAFGSDCSGYNELFPGLEIRIVTLDANFKTPIFRECSYILGAHRAKRVLETPIEKFDRM